MPRVVLAMSGGVDSSVAAHLLIEQGHEVIGVFMRHGEGPFSDAPAGGKHRCCSAADAADARRVADRLNVAFYSLDFQEEFGRIIDYFVAEYTDGRTPNPCVVCNHRLKFGKLFDYADSVGADFVATGHHARLTDRPDGSRALRRAVDSDKDQSYSLFGIERSRLGRILLPVGDHPKLRIREWAAGLGLSVAEKSDSQEICFVEPGRHAQFVRDRRAADTDTSGQIVTTDGQVVGTHEGIEQFTIGQRKGLRVALGEPRFVVRIEADTRRVVIGRREELARSKLTAGGVNWLIDRPAGPIGCLAQIRYNRAPAPAVAEPLPDDRLKVEFAQSQCGVAPGQAVVLYEADRVLGGGWIE